MKRLLGVLLALGLAVTVAADGTVVCTATPHSTGIEFSATPTSAAAGLQCDLPAAEDEGGGVDPRWDDLVAGWKLDESSDGSAPVARADVLGTYELTDNNTVPSAAGLIGNAASFTAANTERLTVSSVFDFSGTWSIAIWVKVSGTTGFRGAYASQAGANVRGYFNTGTYSFVNEVVGYTPAGFSATLDENWHLVQIWHDNADDSIGCRFDGGADATFSPRNPAADTNFVIGATTTAGSNPFNGLIDEVYIWSRVLTSQERTDMYNSGAGRSYPD